MTVTAGPMPEVFTRHKRDYANARTFKAAQAARHSIPSSTFGNPYNVLTEYNKDYRKYTKDVEHPHMRELRSISTGERYLVPNNDYANIVSFMNTWITAPKDIPLYKELRPYYEGRGHFNRITNQTEYTGYSKYYQQMVKDATEDVTEEMKQRNMELDSETSKKYEVTRLLKSVQTPADFIDFVFAKKRSGRLVTAECKGGHIAKLEYDKNYLALRVTFANRGDVVVFFDLPANVAEQLIHLAESNAMAAPKMGIHGRLIERHAVGVEFWNLVRIRGTVHGSRYQFQYQEDHRTGTIGGRKWHTYDYYDPETGKTVHSDKPKWKVISGVPSKLTHADYRPGDDSLIETRKEPIRIPVKKYIDTDVIAYKKVYSPVKVRRYYSDVKYRKVPYDYDITEDDTTAYYGVTDNMPFNFKTEAADLKKFYTKFGNTANLVAEIAKYHHIGSIDKKGKMTEDDIISETNDFKMYLNDVYKALRNHNENDFNKAIKNINAFNIDLIEFYNKHKDDK